MAGRFKAKEMIGAGSFGAVYLGHDTKRRNAKVAIKCADFNDDQLYNEYQIYKMLKLGPGIAKCYWYGTFKIGQSALVMELLGDSLEYHFDDCGSKFSLKTVLMLADQIIVILEYLHAHSLIHRDIKPSNFVMGTLDKRTEVFLIDFGLATLYRNSSTMKHNKYKDDYVGVIGTARYTSLNSLIGVEQSRRDDLESVAYMLLYFLRGNLPWQGKTHGLGTEEKCRFIYMKRRNISVKELCGKINAEFGIFLQYSRNLKYTESPDYSYIRKLFHNLFHRKNYVHDLRFDWLCMDSNESIDLASSSSDEPSYEVVLNSTSSSSSNGNSECKSWVV